MDVGLHAMLLGLAEVDGDYLVNNIASLFKLNLGGVLAIVKGVQKGSDPLHHADQSVNTIHGQTGLLRHPAGHARVPLTGELGLTDLSLAVLSGLLNLSVVSVGMV